MEEVWYALRDGDWQVEMLHRLFQRIQALGASCARFELVQVGEAVLSLEVFLSSFVEGGIIPKPAQLWELDALVQQLRDVAMGIVGEDVAAELQSPVAEQDVAAVARKGQTVFVLENPDPLSGGLCPALNALDLQIHTFNELGDLRVRLKKDRPLAVISDACFLSQLTDSGIIDTLKTMPGKENNQHQGLMTVTGEFYPEMEQAVQQISSRLYDIASGA